MDSDLPTLVVLIGVGVIVYFLPLIIAASRKVPNVGSIAVINIFLGWMLIGWVAALAMAVRTKPENHPRTPSVPNAATAPPPPSPTPLDAALEEPGGEARYRTSHWSEEDLAAVLASFDRRGIATQIQDDQIVVGGEIETLATRLIVEIVGERAIVSPTSPATEDAERETMYSTADWSDEELGTVLDALEHSEVPSYMDEGYLVVDKRWERVVDRIISTITGTPVDSGE